MLLNASVYCSRKRPSDGQYILDLNIKPATVARIFKMF